MKVYRDGIEFYTIKDYKHTGRFMEVACIDCTIKSSTTLGFKIGDYVIFDYNGLRYSLYDAPIVKKQARPGSYGEAFIYELKFKADTQQLTICPFLDIVEGDNNVHFTSLPSFSTYENVYGIIRRIQANLDSLYPNQWRIEVAETDNAELLDILSDAREFSINGENCFDGCKKIYDIWGVSYLHTIDNGVNVITFGKSGERTSKFSYGKGQGLRAIKKNVQNTDELCTRLYAYGSTRNIPARWYNNKGYIGESQYIPNLMLPPSQWKDGKAQGAYIDAIIKTTYPDLTLIEDRIELYGLRPKTFFYDGSDGREEIYPSVEKLTAKNIRDAKKENNDSTNVPSIAFYPDNDRMDYILDGSHIEDDGTNIDIDYIPYSETQEISIGDWELDYDHATTPDSDGNYALFDFEEIGYIFDFYIEKEAKYRLGAIDKLLTVQKNDVYSSVTVEFFIKKPSGQYISLSKELIDERYRIFQVGLPESYVTLDEIGPYWLCTKIIVKWPEDTTGIRPTIDDELSLGDYFTFRVKPASGNITLLVSRGYRVLSSSFNIKIKQIGFDIDSVNASNGATKTIHLKSGMCAGRSFEIVKSVKSPEDDSWVLTCRRSDDSEVSQRFPNSMFPIAKDDQFILLNIDMPDLYIYTAMYRLYDAAYRDLLYYSQPQYLIEPEIDNLQIARSNQLLQEGMYMPIEDVDLSLTRDILIDSVTITNKGTELRSFEVTLRNEKPLNRISKLSERVSNLENTNTLSNKEASRTPAKDEHTTSGNSDIDAIKDWFTLEEVGGEKVLKTKYNLASEKAISWRGVSTSGGGTSEGGLIQRVYGYDNITDVFDDNTKTDTFNAYTIAKIAERVSDIEKNGVGGDVDLTGYATEDWVLGKDYATNTAVATLQLAHNNLRSEFDALNNVLNDDVSGKINTWNEVVDFLDEYSGSQDLATILAGINGDISTLQEKFTKDNIQTTLGIADWALAASKPSYNFSEILNKPTTLTGYGITDALSTSGGTVNGNIILNGNITITRESSPLYINSTSDSIPTAVNFFKNLVNYGGIGMSNKNTPCFLDTNNTPYTLYHTGNFNPADYLPKSGGTLTNTDSTVLKVNSSATSTYIQFMKNGSSIGYFGYVGSEPYTYYGGFQKIIHTGNIGSQSVNYATSAGDAGTLGGQNGEWYQNNILGFKLARSRDANAEFFGILHNYNSASDWANAPTGMLHGRIMNFSSTGSNALTGQLAWDVNHGSTTDTTRNLWWRAISAPSNVAYAQWHQIAFTDSNVASATKLQDNTAYTAWGQTFFENGKPKNVSGTIDIGLGKIDKYPLYNSKVSGFSLLDKDGITRRFGVYSYDGTKKVFVQNCYGGTENCSLELCDNGTIGLIGGNILIGTTTDSGYKLDVNGSIAMGYIGDSTLKMRRNYWNRFVASEAGGFFGWRVNGEDTDVMTLNTGGNLLIGTTTSNGNKLQVAGNISATGSISWGAASDRRLKDNIKTISNEDAINVIMALNPVTFTWGKTATEKDNSLKGLSCGFIADEYTKVIPNSSRPIWEEYTAIDYKLTAAFIVKGLQSHEERLRVLERENRELKNELNKLRGYGN